MAELVIVESGIRFRFSEVIDEGVRVGDELAGEIQEMCAESSSAWKFFSLKRGADSSAEASRLATEFFRYFDDKLAPVMELFSTWALDIIEKHPLSRRKGASKGEYDDVGGHLSFRLACCLAFCHRVGSRMQAFRKFAEDGAKAMQRDMKTVEQLGDALIPDPCHCAVCKVGAAGSCIERFVTVAHNLGRCRDDRFLNDVLVVALLNNRRAIAFADNLKKIAGMISRAMGELEKHVKDFLPPVPLFTCYFGNKFGEETYGLKWGERFVINLLEGERDNVRKSSIIRLLDSAEALVDERLNALWEDGGPRRSWRTGAAGVGPSAEEQASGSSSEVGRDPVVMSTSPAAEGPTVPSEGEQHVQSPASVAETDPADETNFPDSQGMAGNLRSLCDALSKFGLH